MNAMKPKISIVIPAYNEEAGIEKVLKEVIKSINKTRNTYEVLVINDGSTDKTPNIVRKIKKIKLINHEYNKGYGASLKTGIQNSKGDFILIIDADNTYPSEAIPSLIKYTNNYDMVVGARTEKNVKIPLLRRPAKFFLSKLANYLSGIKIPDLNSGLRIFKKDIAYKFFNILPNKFSFTTTITLAYLSKGYSIKYIPIEYHKRKGKSTIHPIKDTINFVLLIFKTIIYFNPLKIFLPFSILLFLIGLLIGSYTIFLERNISDTSVILILTSIQIAFFGFLADLISKKE